MWRSASLLLLGCLACGSTREAVPAPCDSGGAGGAGNETCDADGDGFASLACHGDDCDDTRADVHPGAADTCDGDDNDCDGVADPGDACDCAEPPPKPAIDFADRVCLTGGWLMMGMGITDPQAADIAYVAVPIHRVFVSPFYLDAYEVTNRRFIECLDAGACKIELPIATPSAVWKREKYSTEDQLDRPYWGASAQGAEAFCQWSEGWLPSEAQWERAAAGLGQTAPDPGTPRPFPNGQYPPTCDEDWTKDCFPAKEDFPLVQRVGQLKANPDGIFDLGGNAYEWTADLFSMQAYEACPEPCKNPCFGCADKTGGDPSLAPDKEPWPWSHVTRGGGADILSPSKPSQVVFFRSQVRERGASEADGPRSDIFNFGFRCAYPAQPRR